jgi:hypothetical protein
LDRLLGPNDRSKILPVKDIRPGLDYSWVIKVRILHRSKVFKKKNVAGIKMF